MALTGSEVLGCVECFFCWLLALYSYFILLLIQLINYHSEKGGNVVWCICFCHTNKEKVDDIPLWCGPKNLTFLIWHAMGCSTRTGKHFCIFLPDPFFTRARCWGWFSHVQSCWVLHLNETHPFLFYKSWGYRPIIFLIGKIFLNCFHWALFTKGLVNIG